MTTLTVYQMTFGQSSEGKPGLVFTTEQEEYGNQSVLFVVPIIEDLHHHHPFEFINYFEQMEISFPFQMGEEYLELKGRVSFPEVSFKVPNSDLVINFEIDSDNVYNWRVFPYRRKPYRKMSYVGRHSNLIKKNFGFLVLQPVDLYEMDELFLTHKGVFVGLTPNFGSRENFIDG